MATPRVQLKRIVKIINGGTPTPAEENWNGEIPWATPVDLNNVDGGFIGTTLRNLSEIGVRTGSVLVPEGSVILSTRAPIGYTAVATNQISFNQGCKALVPIRPAETDSRYLRYAIQASVEHLKALGKGSTFLELSTQDLANVRIPLPSFQQQKKIADEIDRALAEIDEFIEDATKLQKLIEEREIAELEKNLIENSTEFVELRRLKPKCISGTSVNAAPWQADDSGFGVLKTGVVSKGYFDPTQNKAVLEESEISRLSTPVKANTIIVNRANSPELVGSAAFVEKDFPNLFLSDKLWQIDFEGANNTHMATVMQTMFFKEQVRQRCVGASSSMQNLSYHDFLSLKVPIISETRINSSNTKLLQINNNLVNLLLERKNILVGQSVEGIQQ